MLRIGALGSQGDGIGELDGRPVYVPLAVPGDRVEVVVEGPKGEGLAARIVRLEESGPDRVPPTCGHFGDCGGCGLQQLGAAAYSAWKSGLLPAALARRGLADPLIRSTIFVTPGTRRRAALSAINRDGRILLGFHARARHRVVDLVQCEILVPELMRLLPALRAAMARVLKGTRSADLLLTWTDSGADLLVTSAVDPDLAGREALIELAHAADVARIAWSRPTGIPDPIIVRRPPAVTFGGISVRLPPGPFLQPSAAGEAALVAAVTEAARGAKVVADLFAGCGTFTFPLAATGAHVHAVEAALPAIEALSAAARGSGLGATVTTERRDLERRPLALDELAGFDAVVFNPPRAGAHAQARMLAGSKVPRVVAVSCNPATFARDARILVDGGYGIDWLQPIDQFPWTAHLEVVASFSREG